MYVCLITGLEWVTPERSMAHLCMCVCEEDVLVKQIDKDFFLL